MTTCIMKHKEALQSLKQDFFVDMFDMCSHSCEGLWKLKMCVTSNTSDGHADAIKRTVTDQNVAADHDGLWM